MSATAARTSQIPGIRLVPWYMPDEMRRGLATKATQADRELMRAETARLTASGKLPDTGAAPFRNLVHDWIASRYKAGVEAWVVRGQPVMYCEHIDPEAEHQADAHYWPVAMPDVMVCSACLPALLNAVVTYHCDSCDCRDGESPEYVYSLLPGATLCAVYTLCVVCRAAHEVEAA